MTPILVATQGFTDTALNVAAQGFLESDGPTPPPAGGLVGDPYHYRRDEQLTLFPDPRILADEALIEHNNDAAVALIVALAGRH